MAKIQVIDDAEGTRVPFLRGMLTRSLHDAGLSFDEAYELASAIRQELGDAPEVTKEELRKRVLDRLQASYSPEVASNYSAPLSAAVTVFVRDAEGQLNAFSHNQHQRCLESCGLSSTDAAAVTAGIHQDLLERGVTEISSGKLGRMTYDRLRRTLGKEAAQRYKVWVHYIHSGRPLLLLLGGTTGTGKSTIATEVAHLLGVVRTQSTDMLREVMRMMIPQRLLPVLHESSFNAWRVIMDEKQAKQDPDAAVANGYRSQAELLAVPCEAVIQRALRERVSLIVEGIHVRPALLERIAQDTDAVIVPVMMAVMKQESLRRRIRGRGGEAPEREAERQLEYFDAIWRLQSYLLSEADRAKVPIIANEDVDQAVKLVMGTIIDTLARGFSARLDQVFNQEPQDPGKEKKTLQKQQAH
jgi:2-phosphoglycerate kinase